MGPYVRTTKLGSWSRRKIIPDWNTEKNEEKWKCIKMNNTVAIICDLRCVYDQSSRQPYHKKQWISKDS